MRTRPGSRPARRGRCSFRVAGGHHVPRARRRAVRGGDADRKVHRPAPAPAASMARRMCSWRQSRGAHVSVGAVASGQGHRRSATRVLIAVVPDVQIGTVRRPRHQLVGLVVEIGDVRVDRGRDAHHDPRAVVVGAGTVPWLRRPAAPTSVDDAGVGDDPGRRDALLLQGPRDVERAGATGARAVQEVLGRRVLRLRCTGWPPWSRSGRSVAGACRRAWCSGCGGRRCCCRRRCRGCTSTRAAVRNPSGAAFTCAIRPGVSNSSSAVSDLLGLVPAVGCGVPVVVEPADAAAPHLHPERPASRGRGPDLRADREGLVAADRARVRPVLVVVVVPAVDVGRRRSCTTLLVSPGVARQPLSTVATTPDIASALLRYG